ncbi:GGDEF domain-containing protein [Allosphingosinicella flava]|uniref:diguanylate cyclase n=1 Tax=Allosphingosinicella flava TaxID=2771430 RepID=A0A7T2GK39_9SPHN|nr:GGDEF domain-containing protein [Sphingosinicella flava]QPQ55326.1 GGDEF domain-containing protein [Sphingosinicella flava]
MATPAKSVTDRRVFDAVGAFLTKHRLDPSPGNYLLAYRAIVSADEPLAREIEDVTRDGVRLSQDDADRLFVKFGLQRPQPDDHDRAYAEETALVEEARSQIERFARVVQATREGNAAYGRELNHTADRLSRMTGAESIEGLLRLTTAMIDRARLAEERLEQAVGEAETLRRKLASATEEAHSDALTGLANRRAFQERHALLSESKVPMCLALCDVDRFKTINDTHGHAVGDRVLKAVGRILTDACGKHLVARYGGEEFAILFSGVQMRNAVAMVETAQAELAARHFKVRNTDVAIGVLTFSAGMVEAASGESGDSLIQRADALLYRAKQSGRDRIEVQGEGSGAIANDA